MSARRVVLAGLGAGVAAAAATLAIATRRNPALGMRTRRRARLAALAVRSGARVTGARVAGVAVGSERRADLERSAVIRSAEDVANELGHMKGAVMKLGQLVGFIVEALPDEARAALATLQADAPPMARGLAESIVREELGAPVHRLFRDWDPEPVAAASIGQVHRAVLRDGREVAVKVQYPGVADALGTDLDSAEGLYALLAAFSLKGLDTRALVDELRARMTEELDYRREAANLAEFAEHYRGHPFIRIPHVVPERSSARVLTTEWIAGWTWDELRERAPVATCASAGEAIWRFAQGSVHRLGAFNGDPHPGNYRFHPDGTVTFLDFGLVKRWTAGEWERLAPSLDAILDGDRHRLVEAMEHAGFLRTGHRLDPDVVFDYVSSPYVPYLSDSFTFSPAFVAESLARIVDVRGPHAAVVEQLDMPPSFVVLDRVVWGVSALLGRVAATGPWRGMLAEYRRAGPPATVLGELDARWWVERHISR